MAKENEIAKVVTKTHIPCKILLSGSILVVEEAKSEAISKKAIESNRSGKNFDFQIETR